MLLMHEALRAAEADYSAKTQLEQHNSQHQVHFARKVVTMTN